jgi:ribonuclease P protein subunit RPR2
MVKAKIPNAANAANIKAPKAASVPNKSLHSRVSYLYQAAMYLATKQQHSGPPHAIEASTDVHTESATNTEASDAKTSPDQTLRPVSRRLVSDLRGVSLRMQMRISPTMKNSICKNCNTMLIDGSTCMSEIENKSKGGKKPWANLLIRKCTICGLAKRFPLAERQKRRPLRSRQDPAVSQDNKAEG